jgi:hypothetical protein
MRVAIALTGVAFAAAGKWLLAFAMAGGMLLLLAAVWFGEKVRVLPDLTAARREYAEERQRRPGESRLRHWWRLFRREFDVG